MSKSECNLMPALEFDARNNILSSKKKDDFGFPPNLHFSLAQCDLPKLFHQRGQGVTPPLLHAGSVVWLGLLIMSNTVVPDEDHSPSLQHLSNLLYLYSQH